MKYVSFIAFSILLTIACTEKKKEQTNMIPVEADNGIGNGAPNLDSLRLKETNNSFISEEKSDSITKSHQGDSI